VQGDEVEGGQVGLQEFLEAGGQPVGLDAGPLREAAGEDRVVRMEVGAPKTSARVGGGMQVGRDALAVAQFAIGVAAGGRVATAVGQTLQEQGEAQEGGRELVVVAVGVGDVGDVALGPPVVHCFRIH
jgi:hypothetical protein